MRLFSSIKYDGWTNTLKNVSSAIKKLLYGHSYTVLLEADINNYSSCLIDIDNVKVAKLDSLYESNLLNLKKERINNWINNGADVYLAFFKDRVVGYCVVHLNKYTVKGVGEVDLNSKRSLWIGPTFVDVNYRSNGINKLLISTSISSYINKRSVALTSANINNIFSIRSFCSNGFMVKNIFKCTYMFGTEEIIGILDNE